MRTASPAPETQARWPQSMPPRAVCYAASGASVSASVRPWQQSCARPTRLCRSHGKMGNAALGSSEPTAGPRGPPVLGKAASSPGRRCVHRHSHPLGIFISHSFYSKSPANTTRTLGGGRERAREAACRRPST